MLNGEGMRAKLFNSPVFLVILYHNYYGDILCKLQYPTNKLVVVPTINKYNADTESKKYISTYISYSCSYSMGMLYKKEYPGI